MRESKKQFFVVTLMFLCGFLFANSAEASDKAYGLRGAGYEMSEKSDYKVSENNEVEKFKYGKSALGKLYITGEINRETTHEGQVAYGVDDNVSFVYEYDGSFQSERKNSWNLNDSLSKVGDVESSKRVRKGMVIVEKSKDQKTWKLATSPINDCFEGNRERSRIYTVEDEDINVGIFYRISVVYEMKRRVSTDKIAVVIRKDTYEYIRCREVYKVFVSSDKSHVSFYEMGSRKELDNNAYTNYGFFIEKNDSSDQVFVQKESGLALEAKEYDYFVKPGRYSIRTSTSLGKDRIFYITVTDGLAMSKVEPLVYETVKDKGFSKKWKNKEGLSFSEEPISSLLISRTLGASLVKSKKNGFDAYGIAGKNVSLYLELNSNGKNIGNGWSVVYDKWGKKENEKVVGISTGEVGKGAIIVQTSLDGKKWKDVDKGRYSEGLYTTDYLTHYSKNESVMLYTPDGEDILNGIYIRVLFAYQISNKNEKEIRDCVEEYAFYLCSNELNAVTFHNLSVTEELEEHFKDKDESTVKLYKTSESMLSGACTTTGFVIDTSMNPTVTYSVKKDEKPIKNHKNNEYVDSGKYEIHMQSDVGSERDVILYVDKDTNEEALNNYFGKGFLSGKRIFSEGDYPIYEAGETSYSISEVTERSLPVSGTITNTTTGTIISIPPTREKKEGSLVEAGQYEAVFTTNDEFQNDDASGDARVFVYRFELIANGAAPGPVVNQKNLKAYAHSMVSDARPVYYGLTYPSAGKGNITMAFSSFEAAKQYAYENEKGMVEQQADGSYRYNGKYTVTQKESYDSNWDLTDALNYFAEQAVQKLYFDLSDQFYYLTLKEDTLENNRNLKTLELEKSVIVFADGEKELLTDLDSLPIINDKPYAYLLTDNSREENQIDQGKAEFQFITDSFGGIDSQSVIITDTNGVQYNIEYSKSVEKQLEEQNCPSGPVTISELNKYGDSNSYQALYISPNDNRTKLTLLCYHGQQMEEVTIESGSDKEPLIVDSFGIKEISDELDPFALVVVSGENGQDSFVVGDDSEKIWTEPGNYTIKCVNRLGYYYTKTVTVVDSDNAVVTFEGEETEQLQSIMTFFGAANVVLPELTRYGYELVGFADSKGQVLKGKINTVSFRGEQKLTSVWKAKQVNLSYYTTERNLLGSTIAEFGKKYDLQDYKNKENESFVGWERDGVLLEDNYIVIDTEESIELIASVVELKGKTAIGQEFEKMEWRDQLLIVSVGLIIFLIILLWLVLQFKKGKRSD